MDTTATTNVQVIGYGTDVAGRPGMICRCGHGRHHHRATRNAISKRRARGDRRPARQACQFGSKPTATWSPPAWLARCGCRDFVPPATPPTRADA